MEHIGYIPPLSFFDFQICEHCIYGKQIRKTSPSLDRKQLLPLELVLSDVCGPMPTKSLGGSSYFVTFIDDSTRKVWLYGLQSKDQVFSTFQKFLSMVENQYGRQLKSIRIDNGGEYVSHEFINFCDKRGIKRQLTAPYTPNQNGVAERINRMIREKVTYMLSMAGLTPSFWAEVAITAVHLINLSPSAPLDNQIPKELWTGKMPHYAHLRVFGCKAYAHVPKELRQKLDPKSQKCIFIGYGTEGEMGYRLWNPESHKVIRSSHVIFNESKMHKKPIKEIEFKKVTFEDIPTKTQKSIIVPSVDNAPQEQAKSSSQALRRSARVSHPPNCFVPSLNYVFLSCYAKAIANG